MLFYLYYICGEREAVCFFTERGECLPHRMDDDFLIRFLRARNFNLKRAHRLVSRKILTNTTVCDDRAENEMRVTI